MQELINSTKTDDGIVVVWNESGQIKDRSFTYQELLEMKIDAGDLLARPMLYKIEVELNKFVLKR